MELKVIELQWEINKGHLQAINLFLKLIQMRTKLQLFKEQKIQINSGQQLSQSQKNRFKVQKKNQPQKVEQAAKLDEKRIKMMINDYFI
jgi:hypothetical protein